MSRVDDLKEHIASTVAKVREQQRFDDIWEWRVAENMAGEVAEQMTLFSEMNAETVRMIDVALKAKPMKRAGALKKARAMAVKAAHEAAKVAEAV